MAVPPEPAAPAFADRERAEEAGGVAEGRGF
jgi:hypothetical protein